MRYRIASSPSLLPGWSSPLPPGLLFPEDAGSARLQTPRSIPSVFETSRPTHEFARFLRNCYLSRCRFTKQPRGTHRFFNGVRYTFSQASERFPSSPCFCLSLKADAMRKASHYPLLRPAGVPLSSGPLLFLPKTNWARRCRALIVPFVCLAAARAKQTTRDLPGGIEHVDAALAVGRAGP